MTEQAGTERTEKAPAKVVEKPMGATQRRDLAKLIDNDFESLKGELGVFANQLKIQRERQIEEEYEEQERQARQVEAEWNAFGADLRRQADEWMRRKREEGYQIGYGGRYGDEQAIKIGSIKVTVPAKERALKDVDNIVNHQKMTALQALERQRLQLQRDVLLDGLISTKARELLDKMPNPRELLAQVMQGAQEAGLIPARRVQQIEGGVQVRHGHDDPQAVYIGEILE